MSVLPKHKLKALEEAARGVATPAPWDGSHGSVWGGPTKELIGTFFTSRDSYLVRKCDPDIVLELIRGYRLAKDAGLLGTSALTSTNGNTP